MTLTRKHNLCFLRKSLTLSGQCHYRLLITHILESLPYILNYKLKKINMKGHVGISKSKKQEQDWDGICTLATKLNITST